MLSLPYPVEVQIVLAVLWTGYRIFLSRQSFFARNRACLLVLPLAACLLPLLSIPVFPSAPAPLSASAGLDWTAAAPVAGAVPAEAPAAVPADWVTPALYVLWGAGAAFCLLRYGLSGLRLWRTVRRCETCRDGSVRVFRSASPVGSFSFFGRICVEDSGDGRPLPEVIAHERCHAQLGHSWDRVWAAALCAVLWWSPFVWLWSRSLREVHEFQADRRVLDKGFDSKQYIYLIIRQFTDMRPELVSGFSYSLIKKRLVMISKESSPRRSKLRILLSLPLVGLMLPLVSFTPKPSPTPAMIATGMTTVRIVQPQDTVLTDAWTVYSQGGDSSVVAVSLSGASAAQSPADPSVRITRTRTVRNASGRDTTVTDSWPADSLSVYSLDAAHSLPDSPMRVIRTRTVRSPQGRDTTITDTLAVDSPAALSSHAFRSLSETRDALGENVPDRFSSVRAGLRQARAALANNALRQAGARLMKVRAELQQIRAGAANADTDAEFRQARSALEETSAGLEKMSAALRQTGARLMKADADRRSGTELRRVRAELAGAEAELRRIRAGFSKTE